MKRILSILAAVAISSLFVAAQAVKSDTSKDSAPTTEIRKVAAPQTSAIDGQANYKAYCAACHGVSGKGDGPAASALKVPPTDLTRLAANAGGKFPTMHVETMIRNADNPFIEQREPGASRTSRLESHQVHRGSSGPLGLACFSMEGALWSAFICAV